MVRLISDTFSDSKFEESPQNGKRSLPAHPSNTFVSHVPFLESGPFFVLLLIDRSVDRGDFSGVGIGMEHPRGRRVDPYGKLKTLNRAEETVKYQLQEGGYHWVGKY